MSRALRNLEVLLEDQRSALLSGDLDALARLPDRLSRAMRSLEGPGLHPDQIGRLKEMADHNARLLLAAQRGVAQTIARRADHRAVPLTTYDATGRRSGAAGGGTVLSRR